MTKTLFTFLLSFTLLPTPWAFQPPSLRIHQKARTSLSSTPTDSEIATLFSVLRDTTVSYDPSRGTCCRNKCSGCTYLDSQGNFSYEEYNASDVEEGRGGWIAPYTKVDFGDKVHVSTWSKLLFAKGGEIERNELQTMLSVENKGVSTEAINALWVTLSPSVGYPKLKSTEVVRAIKGIKGSNYEMGGAVDYPSFHKAMLSAANVGSAPEATVDYDSMTKEELLELVEERGMKATFPKMKRIIIEELRFFDANGRQGKRHPVKNTLS